MRQRLKNIGWRTFAPTVYWSLTWLLRFLLTVFVRWNVTGRERVPKSGALMVVANHLNNGDPPILGAAIATRRIRFMAKVELFKMPLGAVIKLWDAFPVKRFEADIGAMLAAERILRKGGVLGMFPEGHRSRTGYMGPVYSGTAVIALRTGATILPCAITGSENLSSPLQMLIKRARFAVSIGEPIKLEAVRRPTDEQVSELTQRIVAAIQAQLPEKYLPPATDSEGVTLEANGAGNPG
jgi:1-acyl-sn-glycerol-3-phosphate acyltransferase